MALLMQAMRNAAFTGSTDSIYTRIVGRQGARWTEQTVRGAYPSTRAQRPPAQLTALTSLRDRGVLSESEFQQLRAQTGV
jgi:hypothetical protein